MVEANAARGPGQRPACGCTEWGGLNPATPEPFCEGQTLGHPAQAACCWKEGGAFWGSLRGLSGPDS